MMNCQRLFQMFIFCWASSILSCALAQNRTQVSFNSDAWEVNAAQHEFKTYKGKPSLYLQGGLARLKQASFTNGTIDFDLNVEEGRKFIGVHFRIQGPGNYEEFYIRPHQSGNPDAMQYTPVINGLAGWQLYYGQGYSAAYRYNFGEWMHLRLVIEGDKMDIYLNDMSQPILHAHDLKMDAAAGGIGFGANMGGAYYANLSYQESSGDDKLVKGTFTPPPMATGTLASWKVSEAVAEASLGTLHNLEDWDAMKQLSWADLEVEYSGLLNLAKVSSVSKTSNTILAKIEIQSDKKQLKELTFGYSDAARVFVNGQLMYAGQRRFRSRDYRYLGTIGYFDAVFLPLKKGKNEIIFAITESFGGWGLKAQLDNLDGITVK
ncbi:MAG: hypothetical protein AAF587_05265 [Bacteroidota bacterium]